MKYSINNFLAFLFYIIVLWGCKKLTEVQTPFYNTSAETVFANNENSISVMTGVYTKMSTGNFNGAGSFPMFTSLSADDLTLHGAVGDEEYNAFYKNSLYSLQSGTTGSRFWAPLYNLVYICNAVVENLNLSNGVSQDVKEQLVGEALFCRAFLYFNLVNLYGDVPLILNTEFTQNAMAFRVERKTVYSQIIEDLNKAKELLSDKYLDGALREYSGPTISERVRPTRWAAKALLARVYLFTGHYNEAAAEATEIIDKVSYYKLVTVSDVFLKNNLESVWQIQPTRNDRNTEDARFYILTSSGPTANTTRPVYLSTSLVNLFDTADLRRKNWISFVTVNPGSQRFYYSSKYKNNSGVMTEYLVMIRLAEIFLIRSESNLKRGDLAGAAADLNRIRKRAGLADIQYSSVDELLLAVVNEKRRELFTESGHRWFDLKRLSIVDSVMKNVTPIKSNGRAWESYQQLYPLSFSEIFINPNLYQNKGY